MTEPRSNEGRARRAQAQRTGTLDAAIGIALRKLRTDRELSARQLSAASGMSAAMISRIESGQVSPSIATLEALANSLDVPLVSLFREMAFEHIDFTHVEGGQGLRSTRIIRDHAHEFVNLAFHTRQDIQFEARLVILEKQETRPPIYVGRGVVFLYILEGVARYGYGTREFRLSAGDSLSLDAELSHGFLGLETPSLKFLTVQAERKS